MWSKGRFGSLSLPLFPVYPSRTYITIAFAAFREAKESARASRTYPKVRSGAFSHPRGRSFNSNLPFRDCSESCIFLSPTNVYHSITNRENFCWPHPGRSSERASASAMGARVRCTSPTTPYICRFRRRARVIRALPRDARKGTERVDVYTSGDATAFDLAVSTKNASSAIVR